MHTLSTQELATLKSIRDFPTLLTYLQTDLDWPIDTNDIDDLTFDYTPQELGLEQQHVVKLSSIKQLRPLVTNQPWGIFYLEFEPKRLPVVVLRRILRELVPKKRASANPSDRMVWDKNDLLFISSMGETSHRRISFAHFRGDANTTPVLETFDWDDRETQFNSIDLSLNKLRWPLNPANQSNWRENWASAFTKPHGYTIKTARELSSELAKLAGRVRDRVRAIYDVERKDGPLHKLFDAFKAALVHDLEPKTFADMVAQTVAYGLFTARAETGKVLGLSNLAEMVPATNPFLRELFGEIETLGDKPESYINFDELGVSEIVLLLNQADINAVLEDFGRQTGGGREDPVIHFYESFLKEYDAKQRVQRGVFYTPQPVVSFIVRSVDKILRDEFGCPDGLADTSTWGEMQTRNPELALPKGVTANTPFVQVLDPATGTGTFLVEVIDTIWKTMCTKWKTERKTDAQILAAWNDYVPKHLLPRINGFELMMASYAIAHVKLGLKLKQTGYDFQSGERLRVFLTNTLEEPDELGAQRTWAKDYNFLAHESRAADTVKRDAPINVVVGNPPYSGHSANNSGWVNNLLRSDMPDGASSYFDFDGKPLGEKNPKWLNDDYVKFIRFSQFMIARTGMGILGFITNHGYLDNPTFRGMRQSLFTTFSGILLLDLHGNSKRKEQNPHGGLEENVFDIQQGVAIGLFIKSDKSTSRNGMRHIDLYGSREEKYSWLLRNTIVSVSSADIHPSGTFFIFQPRNSDLEKEYQRCYKITDIMPINSVNLRTHRDALVIDFDRHKLYERVKTVCNNSLTDEQVRQKFDLHDNRDWSLSRARTKLFSDEMWINKFRICHYRPFDYRWIFYDSSLVEYPCYPVVGQFIHANVGFTTTRQTTKIGFGHILATNRVTELKCISHDRGGYSFPLYVYPVGSKRRPNFDAGFITKIQELTGLEFDPYTSDAHIGPDSVADPSLPPALGMFPEYHGLFNILELPPPQTNPSASHEETATPENIFHYAYAIFHAPKYRERYAEFLKIDFPRLPLTSDVALFRALAALGEQLTALHLMEQTGPNVAVFPVKGSNNVEAAPTYTAPGPGRTEGRVSINKAQYFAPVPPDVWAFQVGGYQVCHKWLKDRKGRALSEEDITHYGRIVAALGETIRLMAEIDAVIEEHGGWPLQ